MSQDSPTPQEPTRHPGPWPLIPVFVLATVAWMVLAGIMTARTGEQEGSLHGRVHDLWGSSHTQQAPTISHLWTTRETVRRAITDAEGEPILDGRGKPVMEEVLETLQHSRELSILSTDIDVDLDLDARRKGLMWFSLYDVSFGGSWRVQVPEGEGQLQIFFPFPDHNGVYDDFLLSLGEEDLTGAVEPKDGGVVHSIPLPPAGELDLGISYASRGMGEWSYRPLGDVGRLANFRLDMLTDFGAIDFPPYTLSPSKKERLGSGWRLSWDFAQVVTGHGMGMVMPERIQPGPLAARMSFSAPISLGLFMVWIYALGLVKGVRVHWVNHLFLAASFFSFHLLFGYTADHLPVAWAFGLSAVVSVVLLTSYLRLVVDRRFALVEAGGAQLIYLVGFSLAHFWEGFAGLTVTVLGILTLFALMQLTGRVDWAEVMAKPAVPDPGPER